MVKELSQNINVAAIAADYIGNGASFREISLAFVEPRFRNNQDALYTITSTSRLQPTCVYTQLKVYATLYQIN